MDVRRVGPASLIGVASLVCMATRSVLPAEAAAKPTLGAMCTKAGARTDPGAALLCARTSKGLRWIRVPVTTTISPATSVPETPPAPTLVPATRIAPTNAPNTVPATSGPTDVPRRGTFRGVTPHRATGTAELATVSSSTVLRISDADIQNGPALVLYLTPTAGATTLAGAIRISPLAALTGDRDYALPAGTDPAAYGGVLIWCDRFGVPFGVAGLA